MRTAILALAAVCLAMPGSALAQPATVRVNSDQTVVWQPNFSMVATVVQSGAVLDVVARRGDWYEVVLPAQSGSGLRTGMIAAGRVTLISGTPPSGPGIRRGDATPAVRPARDRSLSGLRAHVDIAYERFHARHSFDAVFGSAGGWTLGAGGEYRFASGLFLDGFVDLFHRTGERVFVFNGEVFKLGIPDSITIAPFGATAGFRFGHGHAVLYLGAGAAEYLYRERAEFSDASENVSRWFAGYHALGGVEWQTWDTLAIALEGRFSRVRHDLSGGVADSFGEHDLGGVEARVKFLFGR